MLLKYLNELDRAVQEARKRPGLEQFNHCAECLYVLRDYLDGQMAPVRERAEEIIDRMLPAEFDHWMSQVMAPRHTMLQVARAL